MIVDVSQTNQALMWAIHFRILRVIYAGKISRIFS
jgi:hypothetical protein